MSDNEASSEAKPEPGEGKAKGEPETQGEPKAKGVGKKKREADEGPRLIVSAPPHIKDTAEASVLMYWVLLALAPITLYAFYLFGVPAVTVVVMSVAGAVGTEAFLQRVLKQRVMILDGSAALTGLLLALTLPPILPWWIPLIGGVAAIGLAKFIFGGLGFNIFNPALVGRQVLLVSWARYMTTGWAEKIRLDGVSGATPLYVFDQVRAGAVRFDIQSLYGGYLLGNRFGSIGEASALLLLAGAALLLLKRVISWEIPVSYVVVVAAFSLFVRVDPIFQVLAGGIILGAFFMATDYVTSPITSRGKLIFGAGAGFVNMLLRFFTGLPEATAFSILFMNAVAPLIDRYTIPRPFGWVRERAAE
ncbi:MAG: RnfABCDGE type electron transport complex subunit D [Actinobacteria bacterium]|nr:MAG: RnfABCDGE type electron transport complex subunit D [Actinomycetota bacterium]